MGKITEVNSQRTTIIYYQNKKGGKINKAYLTGCIGHPTDEQVEDFIKTLNPEPYRAWC